MPKRLGITIVFQNAWMAHQHRYCPAQPLKIHEAPLGAFAELTSQCNRLGVPERSTARGSGYDQHSDCARRLFSACGLLLYASHLVRQFRHQRPNFLT